MFSKTLNPLLENPDINDKHTLYSKSQTITKYKRINAKYNEIVNGLIIPPKEQKITIYKMTTDLNPLSKINNKINCYISALNTGKLKTINDDKMREYNIIYDEDLKRFKKNKTP